MSENAFPFPFNWHYFRAVRLTAEQDALALLYIACDELNEKGSSCSHQDTCSAKAWGRRR